MVNIQRLSILSGNGFQKLPSGLIIQWGNAWTGPSGQAALTLPIVFPNAILTFVSNYYVNLMMPYFCSAYSLGSTNSVVSAIVYDVNRVGIRDANVFFIAIGY